ncbi:MAG: dicarboxylate/amino acid:cation symporter [Rickettsia sp.]|nr:dicarboxylate/amino acid:cation symporter [Rickettsia sp.]
MSLWKKVLIGFCLGIICGKYLPQYSLETKFIGDIFLRLINMVIMPLIFCSLVSGITSIKNTQELGRIGMKSVAAFLCTTIFAACFGLVMGFIIKPGENVGEINFDMGQANFYSDYNKDLNIGGDFSLKQFITNIVPDNIFNAFANKNILQIVFFSIFTGVIINSLGSKLKPISEGIYLISQIVIKMISKIITLSPYAAFALTSWLIAKYGISVLFSLSKLCIAISIAMLCQYLIFGLLIIIFCKISPIPFYKKSLEYQLIALSTSSSKATLATTMEVCKNKLGISESSTSFVLPLGASINMDGFAINLGLTTIFFAQLLNVDLTIGDYFTIILMTTIGSIGGAGLPGASLIILPLVLQSVNLPVEGIAIIAGIDRIMDTLRTIINITGDATITLIVDHSEKKLNTKMYFSKK